MTDTLSAKPTRPVSLLLVAVGVAMVCTAALAFLFPFVPLVFTDARLLSAQAPAASEGEELAEPDDASLAASTASGTATSVASGTAASATPKPAVAQNRLTIERIGVAVDIVEGKDAGALLYGAWRYPGTSSPAKGGNMVLFGHRFRFLPPNNATFYKLDALQEGDAVQVRWNGRTYRYRVTGSKVIPPEDFSVVAQTASPTLTLITCTPIFTTKDRLVVTAERLP